MDVSQENLKAGLLREAAFCTKGHQGRFTVDESQALNIGISCVEGIPGFLVV